MLVNTTVENFKEIKLKIRNVEVNEIFVIDKESGKTRKAEFKIDGDTITVCEPFEYLSTQTLLLKKKEA